MLRTSNPIARGQRLTTARPTTTRLLAGVLLAGALLAAGCGGSDTTSSSGTTAGGTGGTAKGTTPGTTAGSTPATGAAELEGTVWNLETLAGTDGAATPAVASSNAFVRFTDGQLSGNGGCNSVTGTYTVSGDDGLTISTGATTMMACADPAVMTQEQQLLTNLAGVATYAIEDSTLVLSAADGSELATFSAGSSDLAGTTWQVTGVNNGQEAVVSSALTETLTASFDAGGQFSGFGGCNQVTGTYTITGTDGIEIGPLATTMMACDEEVSALETQYVDALEASVTFDLAGGTLTLRDAGGAMQVTAVPAA